MNPDDLAIMAWTQFWQLTALIAVVAVIVRWTARRGPHLAHVLWLVVLAKCLTPPVMASPGGIFCWLQPSRAKTAVLDKASAQPALLESVRSNEPGRVALLASSLKQIAELAEREPHSAAHSAGPGFDHAGHVELARMAAFAAQSESSTVIPARGWRIALLWGGGLWLAGSIVLAVVAAARLASCLHGIRRSVVMCPPDLTALVADLGQRLGLRRPARLIVSASRVGPVVLGLFRPTIVLPAIIVHGKSPRELEPILAHELLHVRRGDLWTGVWQVLAQAVWWFHPLVWLANRLATRAAEACCDEAAIAELGCDSERYAQSLLAVLEQKRGLVSVPAFPGIRPVDVTRERLERIVQLGQGCRTRTPWWCWLVMGAAACIVLPGAALIGTAEEQPAAPADEGHATAGIAPSARDSQEASRKQDAPQAGNRQSPALEIVTVRVANDPGSLRAGETIDLIMPIDTSPTPKAKPDPRILLKDVDSAMTPPTFDTIVHALPDESKGNFPFQAEARRKISQITVELIVNGLGGSRFYPMVGQARHLRQSFKCTIEFDNVIRSDWPIPFTHTDQKQEVVYIDQDQLITADRVQEVTYIGKQDEAVAPRNSSKESREIRVAVASDQAERLKTAIKPGLVVFLSATAVGQVSNLSSHLRSNQADIEEAAAYADPDARVGRTASSREARRLILVPEAATQAADTAIRASANEIIESGKFKRQDATGKLIELRKDVQIRVPDGSLEVTGDNAVIDIQYQKTSTETVEWFTLRLSGNVSWKSSGLAASAKDLVAEWRHVFREGGSPLSLTVFMLEGRAGISVDDSKAQNYVSHADKIVVEFVALNPGRIRIAPRPDRLALEGHVRMSPVPTLGGARSRFDGDRLEFALQRSEIKMNGIVRFEDESGETISAVIESAVPIKNGNATVTRTDDRGQRKDLPKIDANELVTLTYAVADLVIPMQHMSIVMSEDGSVTASKSGGPQVSFTQLIELIQSTIMPDAWENQSGPGSMIPYRTTLSLVIRQTQAVHEQIAELLGQLRRLQDLQCTFQVDVISTSGGNAKPVWRFESDSSGADDGATYLTENQVQALRDTIGLMEKERTAAVTGGFKLVFFNGQGAELKLRSRRLPTKATAPLPPLSIAPIIAADRSAIRLQLAVGISRPLDALARTQSYTIKTGQSLLLDMTDAHLRNNLARMLGAQSGSIRRLHKLDGLFAGGIPGVGNQPDKAALVERVLLLITPRIVEFVEEEERLGDDLPAGKSLSAIVIEGNKTIATKEIMHLITTRTGRPLDPKQVKEDVRTLVSRRWFVDVETRVTESNDGPVLIFRVTERGDQPRQP